MVLYKNKKKYDGIIKLNDKLNTNNIRKIYVND